MEPLEEVVRSLVKRIQALEVRDRSEVAGSVPAMALSDRPAAGTPGLVTFLTDSMSFGVDDGVTWSDVYRAHKCVAKVSPNSATKVGVLEILMPAYTGFVLTVKGFGVQQGDNGFAMQKTWLAAVGAGVNPYTLSVVETGGVGGPGSAALDLSAHCYLDTSGYVATLSVTADQPALACNWYLSVLVEGGWTSLTWL